MTTNPSQTIENYLKAIYELQVSQGRAKTSSLAQRLGVTPGSVTDMLKRLAKQKPLLVSYQSHHGVKLTALGKKKALSVIRRHRLLETFLHDVMGYTWDEIHTEAERLEHCISNRLTEAIAAYLNNPHCDPHGDPIPTQNGKMPEGAGRPLSELAIGSSARITRVHLQDENALQYLSQNDLVPGQTVTVIAKSPLDGQLTLKILHEESLHPFSLGPLVADEIDAEEL
jgi:DtxR family Mn-dependent transcriptional regulator